MSVPIDNSAAHLQAAGLVGGSTGWAVHPISGRDAPDQTVTIAPTGGIEPEEDSERRWLRPRLRRAGSLGGLPDADSQRFPPGWRRCSGPDW